MVSVPLSQNLCLGRRDTTKTQRDSYRDTLGTRQLKRALFNELHRDGQWDAGETVLSEGCINLLRLLGQRRVRRKGSQ
jgi:hypothetical protein